MQELPRATDPLGASWSLLVLLMALGILGWINLVSPKKWKLLLDSLFGLRLGRQSLRDDLDLQDRTLMALLVMATLTVGLFAYQMAVIWAGLPPGLALWGQATGVCAGLVLAQILLMRVIGLLFGRTTGLDEYLFTLLLLHISLGLALLPLAGMLAFPHVPSWRPWLAGAGVLLVIMSVGLRWLRAAFVGAGEGVPLRYIFIYLCALEILPVALACQHVLRSVPIASQNH